MDIPSVAEPKTLPEFFDHEKSKTLLDIWQKKIQNYSVSAKKSETTFTVLFYLLNIPVIILTSVSAALPQFSPGNTIASSVLSLISLILIGIMTHVKPDSKRVEYSNYYTSCERLLERIEFNSSLNLDNAELQIFMSDLHNRIMALIVELPTDTGSNRTTRTTAL